MIMKQSLLIFSFYFLIIMNLNAQTNVFPNSGNVGIGTTNPDSKLTVIGNVNVGGIGNYHLKTRHIDGKETSSSNIDDLYLNYNTGKHVIVGFGGQNSNMYVSGKVGIGTSNPSANLEVKGGNGVAISLYNDQANYWDIVNSTYGKLDFVRGKSNIYMRIDQSGNVGIGTITPDSKLSVNGNIHTKEVKVDLIGWSDFVFAKDYDLPNLKEVEQHIKEKGHLKDIPSEEDVKENGIFLGKMDSKLLQKIEELTLYAIDQEKRIVTLEIKNEKLMSLLEELLKKQD